MRQEGNLTRRQLLGFLALPLVHAGERTGVSAAVSHVRRYRVHATITLLGVPIFTKDQVGGACAMIEESAEGSSRVSSMQFLSGSLPERLHGFNRFGMVQEQMREEAGSATQSEYTSYMTSSPEKNLDQAKKSFTERGSLQPISIAHGKSTKNGYEASLDHLTVSSKATWIDGPKVMDELRPKLSPLKESPAKLHEVYPPFLHAVSGAMKRGGNTDSAFLHNAKLYRLRTRTSAAPGGQLMIGKIAENGSKDESEFRVWFDPQDSTGLPLRFEFRPRSFLHLVFEQDTSMNAPVISSLLGQEKA